MDRVFRLDGAGEAVTSTPLPAPLSEKYTKAHHNSSVMEKKSLKIVWRAGWDYISSQVRLDRRGTRRLCSHSMNNDEFHWILIPVPHYPPDRRDKDVGSAPDHRGKHKRDGYGISYVSNDYSKWESLCKSFGPFSFLYKLNNYINVCLRPDCLGMLVMLMLQNSVQCHSWLSKCSS